MNRVKQCRIATGLKQQDLARLLNISVFHLNRVENWKRPLKRKLAVRIASVLKCSTKDLFF